MVQTKDKEHSIIVNAGALIDSKGKVLGGFEMWRDATADKKAASNINALKKADKKCRVLRELFWVSLYEEFPSLSPFSSISLCFRSRSLR